MKREEKSAVSRQRILAAAMEEFSRKGYEGASLSSLCAEKEISTLGELISAAEENMGNEPVPVRITDPKLDPDTMNRALQQAGGGYLYCGLNKDATAIVCSAPWNMSVEDCLSALVQAACAGRERGFPTDHRGYERLGEGGGPVCLGDGQCGVRPALLFRQKRHAL